MSGLPWAFGWANIDPAALLAIAELKGVDYPPARRIDELRARLVDRGYIRHVCGPCEFVLTPGEQCPRCGRCRWKS